MDTQNLPSPPARSFATAHHEQVLPMLTKPAAWAAADVNAPSDQPALPDHNASSPIETTNQPSYPGDQSSNSGNQNPNAVSKLRKPRKGNNASGGRSSLFWVHTDPQSASEGRREETLKRIRSHVMSEHNRKKRESTKRYSNKSWKHLAFQPVETTATAAAANNTATSTTKSKSPAGSSRATTRSQTSPVVDQSVETESPDAVQADNAGNVMVPAQPWGYLGQGAKDPFCMTHTPLSDRMFRHLQNCKLPSMTAIRM